MKHTGKNIKFIIIHVQPKAVGNECDLFAIAFTVASGFGLNPAKLLFQQEKMRDYLIACLEEKTFSNFPYSINTNWRKKKTVIIREKIFCLCRGLYDMKWFSAPATPNGSFSLSREMYC